CLWLRGSRGLEAVGGEHGAPMVDRARAGGEQTGPPLGGVAVAQPQQGRQAAVDARVSLLPPEFLDLLPHQDIQPERAGGLPHRRFSPPCLVALASTRSLGKNPQTGSISNAPFAPGWRVLSVQVDGPVEIGDRLRLLAPFALSNAPVGPGFRVLRAQLDGPGEVIDGLVVLAQVTVSKAPAGPGWRVPRVQVDGPGTIGHSLLVAEH